MKIGSTESHDFPTVGAYDDVCGSDGDCNLGSYYLYNPDVFVVKLSPTGGGYSDLVYGTFVGTASREVGRGIAVDSAGHIYVTGWTNSSDFPTTSGAFDTSYNGGEDVFVLELDPTDGPAGLRYGTYLGGSGWAEGQALVLDEAGNVYVAGITDYGASNDFPATPGAYSESANEYQDIFVAKLVPAGNGAADLLYSTFLGGSSIENWGSSYWSSLAVDKAGDIYVAGETDSADFPTTPGAFMTNLSGAYDSFLSKINPAGNGDADLLYSTFFGAASCDDIIYAIALGSAGKVYVTGQTCSDDFPTTPGAYDETISALSYYDAFFAMLSLAGNGSDDLLYSTYLGGDYASYQTGSGIAVDRMGNAYIAGRTDTPNFPTTFGAYDTAYNGDDDVFVAVFSGAVLPCDQLWGTCECPFGCASQTGNWVGGINTRCANYHYGRADLSVGTIGLPLRFERHYNSGSTMFYSATMGYGWTHSYDMDLTFPGDPGGEMGVVILKGRTGARFRFTDNGDGTYTAFPGVRATLAQTAEGYTVTGSDQSAYVFDGSGRLLEMHDSHGNVTSLTYGGDGRLAQVTDSASGRYLDLGYDGGWVSQVSDSAGRSVQYGYDASGDLTTVTDVREQDWTLRYMAPHLLYEVVAPDGSVVERVGYDAQGNANRLEDGLGNGSDIDCATGSCAAGGTATVTDAAGGVTVDHYDSQGMLVQQEDAVGGSSWRTYDEGFNLASSTDPLSRTTQYAWSACGCAMTAITDTLGNAMAMEYDGHNNLTAHTNAAGQTTRYTYDAYNNLVSATDALSHTTVYTYNATGQLVAQENPLGHVTWYGYDDFGQRTVVIDALGHITTYGYDAVGRLITTTQYANTSQSLVTVNEYDAEGNLTRVTRNYLPGQPQNYQDRYNLVTEYEYDMLGRQVLVADTLGNATYSEYDGAGRLVRTTRNYLPGQPQNYESRYNLVTEYGYNALGRQTLVTDTLGSVTYTEYDALGRLERTWRNYLPGYPQNYQNQYNLVTEYGYDDVGNQTSVTDTLGYVTYTEYDELNRVTRTWRNYLPGQPQNYQGQYNLVTEYSYDVVGRQVWVTDTMGNATYTEYDALGRPVTTTVNYVDGVYDPDKPDEDLISVSVYDDAGRVAARIDPAGRETRYEYDALGRQVAVIQNYEDGVYEPEEPDRDVRSETVYNDLGQVVARVAVAGERITTTYTYDDVGRLVTTTNALSGTTTTVCDVLGRRVETIDAEGHSTYYAYDAAGRLVTTTDELSGTVTTTYDALGRQIAVTDALAHTTVYTYNAAGRLVAQEAPLGNVTLYEYDALGRRTVITDADGVAVTSFYDAAGRLIETRDALGNGTQYGYDALGRRVTMTDARGTVTKYEYDDAGRLVAVVENYLLGQPSNHETNVRTEYTYDVSGNLTAVADALDHTTVYTYDLVGQRVAEEDPLGYVTRYAYDGHGRRVSEVYPDAAGSIAVTTDYNALGWPTQVEYPAVGDAPGFTVEINYDALGHREVVTDAVGAMVYDYDALYRPLGIDAPTGDAQYVYNALGQRVNLIYPTGEDFELSRAVVTYTHDAAGRLRTVTDWTGGMTVYTYTAAGRLSAIGLPNGVETQYAYDSAGRLVEIEHSQDGELIGRYEYALDSLGNRVVVTETLALPEGQMAAAFGDGAGAMAAMMPTSPDTPSSAQMADPTLLLMVPLLALTTLGRKKKWRRWVWPVATVLLVVTAAGMSTMFTAASPAMAQGNEDTRVSSSAIGDAFVEEVGPWQSGGVSSPASSVGLVPALADYTIEVLADQAWQDFGITLEAGQQFQVEYISGEWTYWAGHIPPFDAGGDDYICGAPYCCEPLPYDRKGALIGRIDSDVFFIGNGSTFTAGVSGALLLQMNDCAGGWGDNTGSVVISVTVFEPPSAGFDADPTEGYAPLTVTFTDTSAGDIDNYLWEYGDGITSTTSAAVHTHTYAAAGVYTASLTVEDAIGQTDTATTVVVVNEMPTGPGDVVVSVADTDGDPEPGLRVYVFDGTTYTGYNKTTDASGQAVFTLPQGDYRFRADKNSTQFWSGEANHCAVPICDSAAVTTTIPVVVAVADTNGSPEAGLKVYAFDGTTYTGYNKTTDASGLVTFTLPMGDYRFRADKNSTQFWSGGSNHCTLPGCNAATITTTIPVVVTVADTDSSPENGLKVYAFDGTTYTGYNRTTDASGLATFTLPLGDYHFRADKNGTQFWSGVSNHCTLPGCTTAAVTTTIPVVVTVVDTDSSPENSLKVYAFDGTTYTGYNKTTDASGLVTFTLPLGGYRFRADKNGTQFWSGATSHCTLPGCTSATVTTTVPVIVTVEDSDGSPEAGLKVYAFDDTTYTGYNKTTDASGLVTFTLPMGDYRFRADKNNTQYWSGAANHCTVPGCTATMIIIASPDVTVAVRDTDGVPEQGLKVYVFDEATYTGYNGTTNISGTVTFTLPQGDCRFRADKNGTQFWSSETNHCGVPGCAGAIVTTTVPIVVTVADTGGSPEAGLKVYAFDDTTYTGYNKTTDASGLVTFTLPLGDYRFRADKNGTQFWSSESNHCTLPGCTMAEVTTTIPVAVTVVDTVGSPGAGLKVYAFDGTTYTGYNKTTDAGGQATFTLPAGDYRFRADKDDTQYWSGETNHCTLPGCTEATITLPGPAVIARAITYTYDPLGRLTDADYSSGESFEYAYDQVGNRTAMTSTTPLSGTLVTTYTFDAANHLAARSVSDGRSYTYDWSQRGQLLAEWTQGYPVRTFAYDGAGHLVQATVFTLTTKFTYNGLGVRTNVEVVGQDTTTVTLDYAANNRILAETTLTGTVQYLYGHDCLGELRDDEWLYYLNDGNGLVRQGADEQGDVESTWLFDPDGTVLEGPEGPVSHLVCGGVYDWSTGLIYKNNNYFDPNLGIWLALAPLVVVQSWRRRKKGWRGPWAIALALFLVGVSGMLTGCGDCEGPPMPPPACAEVTTFGSLGSSLGDNAVFVGPTAGNSFSEYPPAITWQANEKQIVADALTDVIVNVYGGATGFGDLATALSEFGVSTDDPVILIREQIHSTGNTDVLAACCKPYLFIYDEWVVRWSSDPLLQEANLTHEMAHYWAHAHGGRLNGEMRGWINWGDTATHYASTNPGVEDLPEAVRLYFWARQIPLIEEKRRWTDDDWAGLNDYPWTTGPDQLMLDPSPLPLDQWEPSETGTIQVKDRYDWLQIKFGKAWLTPYQTYLPIIMSQ